MPKIKETRRSIFFIKLAVRRRADELLLVRRYFGGLAHFHILNLNYFISIIHHPTGRLGDTI
jgi:lipoate-protein ligase A